MTEPLHLKDSYLKEFNALVKEVNGNKVILDKTVFYSTSGGQPFDTGMIIKNNEEFKVINCYKENNKVIHELDKEGLQVNDNIKGVIDWDRRYRLMRSHTALHILSSIVNKETNALITGGNIDVDESRVDFSLENFDKDLMLKFVEKVNELIKTNQDVSISFMNREEALKIPGMVKLANVLPPEIKELRIVKIGNIDEQADGGTHVKNTSEIGEIEFVKAENKGKDRRRVYFKLKD